MRALPAIALWLALVAARPVVADTTAREVLEHYAGLAYAAYSDAHAGAVHLHETVRALIARPTEDTLAGARAGWRAARVPYQQTEAFRFANPLVDEWEGRVNAWPLDEGLIDYVASRPGFALDENPYAAVNVIANQQITLSGRTIDARRIDAELLTDTLHQIDHIEANVAIGYHAVEFLLWGQDLNGTGPGAGRRPASDYDTAQCTGGHCDRRATYLELVTRLLVGELAWMQEQWRKGGQARESLGKKTEEEAVAGIVLGLARFAMGELAGERMKLGLMLHDPEEEQDCFSDNTHWSHYYNSLGLRNVYTGIYVDRSGRKMEGPSLSDLVRQGDAEVDRRIRAALEALLAATRAMVDSAEREGVAYDQLLAEGNDRGRELILTAITALTTLSQGLDRALVALGIDHLADDPGALAP